MDTALRRTGVVLALSWSLFQLGTGLTLGLPDLIFLPLHVGFALAVTFALVPAIKGVGDDEEIVTRQRGGLDQVVSIAAVLVSIAITAYFVLHHVELATRIPLVDQLSTLQLAVGLALIVLVLEATRRTVGMGMVVVLLAFIAYAFFGYHLPGSMATTPITIGDFVDQQVFTTEGIFGSPTSISATYVFYFVLFAAFLEISGGGKLFIDLALQMTSRSKGGAAKAAVVGSALMGMTSGSAVANVMSVGVFTIPLMKKTGYSARFAGAVEALASTGGQIMPPLMGAAAFIMANTLGVSYGKIVIAAAIPAVLYYAAVFFTVDLEARRSSLGGIDDANLQKEGYLKRLHLLIPLIFLVYSVVSGRSLMISALQAIGLVIIVSWLSRATRLLPASVVRTLSDGAARVITVAIPCAAAGIIVAIVVQSGIGLRFTQFLVDIAGSRLYVVLPVVMAGCIIMGMGLPTTAAYIMASTLFVPALTTLGTSPLAAHMFVFYFACLSMITPPVALASYSAAAIAGAPSSAVGWTAVRIALPVFLVPYAFVNADSLLAQGDLATILVNSLTALAGIGALAAATVGFFRTRSRFYETIVLAIGACALIYPDVKISLAGAAVVALIWILQHRRANSIIAAPETGFQVATFGADPRGE